jgi:hypothetical protein
MADLATYTRQLEGFRASDEARDSLVSVRFLPRVQRECSLDRAKETKYRRSSKNTKPSLQTMLT